MLGNFGPGSFGASVYLLATAAFGIGVLALPFTVRTLGLVCATGFFIVAGLCMALSNCYLGLLVVACNSRSGGRSGRDYNNAKPLVSSYGALVEYMLGGLVDDDDQQDDNFVVHVAPRTRRLVTLAFDFLLYLYASLQVVVCLMFISDFICELLDSVRGAVLVSANFDSFSVTLSTRTVVILVLAAIAFPLACSKKLSELRFLSQASLAAYTLVALIIVGETAVTLYLRSGEISERTPASDTRAAANHFDAGDTDRIEGGGLWALLEVWPTSMAVAVRMFGVMLYAYENQLATCAVIAELNLIGRRGSESSGAGQRSVARSNDVQTPLSAPPGPPQDDRPGTPLLHAVRSSSADWISSNSRIPALMVTVATIVASIFLVISLAVVARFGLRTEPDFLGNYASTFHSPSIVICRILLTYTVGLSMVLTVWPGLQSLERVWRAVFYPKGGNSQASTDAPFPRRRLTLLTIAVSAGIASWVTNVASFIGIASSLFASLMDLAIPGALAWAASRSKSSSGANPRSGSKFHHPQLPLAGCGFGPVLLGCLTVLMWASTLGSAWR